MESNLFGEAWQALESAVVEYNGKPVGTVAARGPGEASLNYDQVFTRDFAVSAIAFLLNGRADIVKNFLTVVKGSKGVKSLLGLKGSNLYS